ncbi:hypothetical protein DCAR_0518770 [Daucus carota subsp. sativus]|uniref:Uncharacterized protein n=1 Tax=Daucus carota subsp. sativus TaxID=79200 RepID=A0A164XH39_DAUCS|nr:PREDICTED: GDSL esterase/lipase At3g48460-like [Daucus carota subsp. sativus]WOG99422.1 hypothetical protein DCAR_0518770 [Daucus carota subsp. sativus]
MSRSLQIHLMLLTLALISPFTHSSTQNLTNPSPFTKIYAFGDSFTDTGNTKSLTTLATFRFASNPPYGNTFFHHPTNRYSDGRLVVDFLAEKLSLPYLPPYLDQDADRSHGVNFAVAGATAIELDFFLKNNVPLFFTPKSLRNQLDWFAEFLGSRGCRNLSTTPQKCGAVFDEALVWVGEIGVNDYAYSLTSTVPDDIIRNLTIDRVTRFLQALLKMGAKYVIAQGLPATGCLAFSMETYNVTDRDEIGCVRSVNNLSTIHNNIFRQNLAGLRKEFPDAVIAYADYDNAYRNVVKNRGDYGINHPFKACCGAGPGEYNFNILAPCGSIFSTSCTDPSEYINWDGVHLTEAMYKAVSEEFFAKTDIYPSFRHLLEHKRQSVK